MEKLDNFVEGYYRSLFEYFEDEDEVCWNTKPNDEIMDAYLRDEFLINALEMWESDDCFFPYYFEQQSIEDIMDFKTCCDVINIINSYYEARDEECLKGQHVTPVFIVRAYAYVYMKCKSLEQLKYILGIEEQGYVLK